MTATNSELDDILKPFHLRDAGGIKCGNAKHKAKRAILAWLEAEKKAYAAEAIQQKIRYLNHFDRTITANGTCELFEALDKAGLK